MHFPERAAALSHVKKLVVVFAAVSCSVLCRLRVGEESVESAGELVVALRVGGAPGLVLNRIVFLQVSHSTTRHSNPLHLIALYYTV